MIIKLANREDSVSDSVNNVKIVKIAYTLKRILSIA